MIWLLRCLFGGELITVLRVTGWASARVALWYMPRELVAPPWFIATS